MSILIRDNLNMSQIKEEAISNYREDTGENQWFRTNCFFVFDKLKGVAEPENHQKSQPAGSWFKCLVKDHECIKGRFICFGQIDEILHKCTLEEIKEHTFTI